MHFDQHPEPGGVFGSDEDILAGSSLYKEFLAEREEILRHKWLESERAGYDIGFDRALTDWCARYRRDWRLARHRARMAAHGTQCPQG